MMTTWIKAGLALVLGAGGGSWLLSSFDGPGSVLAPPVPRAPAELPGERPAPPAPPTSQLGPRPLPIPGKPLPPAPVLSSLQRAEAFGDDEVSVSVMDARHVITSWVRDAVKRCIARSTGDTRGSVGLDIDIEMVDRKVSFFVGTPAVLGGHVEQVDLQCLAKEVGGRHRFRSRGSLGDDKLTGQETVTVQFTSRGARAASCPPASPTRD